MQQWKWRFRGKERLLRKVQHHARILADRIQQNRVTEFGDDLAHDADRLGFEALQMIGQDPRLRGLIGGNMQRRYFSAQPDTGIVRGSRP